EREQRICQAAQAVAWITASRWRGREYDLFGWWCGNRWAPVRVCSAGRLNPPSDWRLAKTEDKIAPAPRRRRHRRQWLAGKQREHDSRQANTVHGGQIAIAIEAAIGFHQVGSSSFGVQSPLQIDRPAPATACLHHIRCQANQIRLVNHLAGAAAA